VTSFSKPNRSSGESKNFFYFWTVGSVVGGGEEEEEGISWRLEGCAGIFELLWETIGGCGVVECGHSPSISRRRIREATATVVLFRRCRS
jgi:hypothetical protein